MKTFQHWIGTMSAQLDIFENRAYYDFKYGVNKEIGTLTPKICQLMNKIIIILAVRYTGEVAPPLPNSVIDSSGFQVKE